VLETDHESVIAFVRSYEGSGTQFGDSPEDVLCVFSFAHNPISVTIQAEQFAGSHLFDLFGGGEFPTVGEDGTITLTLATQSFYWLHVGSPGFVSARS
jgi:maltose alpha-D-glucosyltransferase/alpha-amylase